MKRLKAYQARLTIDLIKELKRAQKEIKRKVLEAASDPNLGKSAKRREKLFAQIEQHYKQIAEGIDAQLKTLANMVGEAEHKAALGAISNARVVRYDPERNARYFSIIHPSNERNIAAVFTDNMSEAMVRGLRTAFIETFRAATVAGQTAAEMHKALRDRWDAIAGDNNSFRFVDRAGRRWNNDAYLQMLVRTNAQRVATESRMDTYIANGYSMARIPPTVDSDCPICAAWAGRIIQIAGKSKEYPTYEEAQAAGMFHPNCVHAPEPIDDLVDAQEIEVQRGIDKPDADEMADVDFMQQQKDQLDELRYTKAGLSRDDARRAVTADRLEDAIRIGALSDEAAQAARLLTPTQLDNIRMTGIPAFDRAPKGMEAGTTFRGKILVPAKVTAGDILNLLNIPQDPAVPVEPMPPPPTPKKKPPLFPDNPDNLKVVRALGGSTGAELVEDEFGQQFVRKRGGQAGGAAADHVRAEAAADEVYRVMGVKVPDGRLYERDGMPPVKLTRFIDGAQPLGEYLRTAKPRDRKRVIEAIQRDFDLDVILGNRDVIGASRDNILVDKDGVPWRIDNGAAFSWRAQGARKSDWDKWPSELFTMQTASINEGVFDKVSATNTVIRSLDRDAAAILDATPQGERAIIKGRIKELQELGMRAADFKASGYIDRYNDMVIKSGLELAKEGFRETIPRRVSPGNFGFFRTSERPDTQPNSGPGGLPGDWKEIIINAAKSINHHAGKTPNMAKIEEAESLKPILKELVASQTAGAAYWLDAVNAISENREGGKIPMLNAAYKIIDKTPPSAHSYSSLTEHAHDFIKRIGGDPHMISDWQRGQSIDSWSDGATPRKVIQALVRPAKDDTYERDPKWGGEEYSEAKKELQRDKKRMALAEKTFAAYDAVVQLALENVTCERINGETREVDLIRTESGSVARHYKFREGELVDFKRGACESHSIFEAVTVYGANNGTVTRVPFSQVKGLHFFERLPGSGEGCFLSEKENEVTADARGCPTMAIGKVDAGQVLDSTIWKRFDRLVVEKER